MQARALGIDDIVEGIVRLLPQPAKPDEDWHSKPPDPGTSFAPYRVYNVGNHQPVELLEFVSLLERALGRPAVKRFLPIQPGDVVDTYADVEELARTTGFRPSTPFETGIGRFVKWNREYYRID